MPVSIRRDIAFTRLVYETRDGAVISSPWTPTTRVDLERWEARNIAIHARSILRPLYRINARLKPHQRPE